MTEAQHVADVTNSDFLPILICLGASYVCNTK